MSRSASEELLANRYELIEPIGAGGMSEVHRGWDTLLRRHVAIKLFQPGFDAAAAQRFDNEIRALANLSHAWLVSVYDADTHEGRPFVVLQLIEGHTLRDRIERGPLSPDQARRLGAGLADALAHVHAHGLVHRDVKPSNILLDHDDNAYLADFGLAHLTGATRLTRTDQLVGTAAYLAPEQVLGQDVDHPADVYALGLVLLECLTGRREYQGGDVEAAVARLHRAPVIPEHLPADLGRLLSRMTASAPHDRPTASECAQVLCGTTARPDHSAVPLVGSPLAHSTPADSTVLMDTVAESPAAAPEVAPRNGLRHSRKALITAAGALIGALSITTAATMGQEPATSEPTPSAPPAASAQATTTAPQQFTQDAPQAVLNPQAGATAPTSDAARVTTTPQAPAPEVPTAEVPVSEVPVSEAPTATSDPTSGITSEPPAATTTQEQTSTPVAPTSETPQSSAETGLSAPPTGTGQ